MQITEPLGQFCRIPYRDNPDGEAERGIAWVFSCGTGLKKSYPPVRTAQDEKLIARTGLDEITLRRLRKEFYLRCSRLSYPQRLRLAEAPTCVRLRMMIDTLQDVWQEQHWRCWLTYLEHTREDLEEMCQGEYPISPYLIRVFSALFGIKVDFLLLGSMPTADRTGASIEILPLTGIY